MMRWLWLRSSPAVAPIGIAAVCGLLWWASFTPIERPSGLKPVPPRTFVSYVDVSAGYYACWNGPIAVQVVGNDRDVVIPSWGYSR